MEYKSPSSIISSCVANVPIRCRKAVEAMMYVVLSNQLVSPDASSNVAYEVTCGAGMGLTFSPEVANMAFYELAERH